MRMIDAALCAVQDLISDAPTIIQPNVHNAEFATDTNAGSKDNNVPANNPLTLDELREMDGEPVWEL